MHPHDRPAEPASTPTRRALINQFQSARDRLTRLVIETEQAREDLFATEVALCKVLRHINMAVVDDGHCYTTDGHSVHVVPCVPADVIDDCADPEADGEPGRPLAAEAVTG